MTYGIRVKGQQKTLQIDSEYANFAFYQKGEATLAFNSAGFKEVTLTLAAPNPAMLVAVKGLFVDRAVGAMSYRAQGGSIVVRFVASGWTDPVTFRWYTFVPASSIPPPSEVGVKIRKRNGDTAFISSFKYLKAMGFITPQSGGDIFIPPAGVDCACVLPGPYWEASRIYEPSDTGFGYQVVDTTDSVGVAVYSGGVRVMPMNMSLNIQESGSPGRSTVYGYGSTEFMVIDVTGY